MTDPTSYSGPAVFPNAIIIAALSSLTIILDIPPLVWHARNHNFAAASLVFWVILLNLMYFVNAIIWRNDDAASWNDGKDLCDVEVKLQVGAWVALTGALACIMRNLARVLDTENGLLIPTKAQRIRRQAYDIFLCFGFPVIIMGVSYIPQHFRYFLIGISGCTPSFDLSWPSIVLVYIWPPILSLIDACYAILLIIRIHRYRRSFSMILSAAGTTKSRFMRLFIMSTILVVIFTPTQLYTFYFDIAPIAQNSYSFSWHAVHQDDAVIGMLQSHGNPVFDRWIGGAAGVLVFVFFGLGEDAMRMYRRWAGKTGVSRIMPGAARGGSGGGSLFGGRGSWTSVSDKAKLLFSSTTSAASSSRKSAPVEVLPMSSSRGFATHPRLSAQSTDAISTIDDGDDDGGRYSFEKVINLSEMLNNSERPHMPPQRIGKGGVLVRKEIWQTHARM